MTADQTPPNDTGAPVWPQGGYAPGSYWCKCVSCNQQFTGDKRAYQCPDCIIQALASHSSAREAAAWIAGRDAAVRQMNDDPTGKASVTTDNYPGWFCGRYESATELAPPTDPAAALDRLIAEARREVFEEAADICKAQAKPFARDFVLRRLAKQGYSMTSRVKQRMLVRLSRQLRDRARKEGQS